ncbi:MAG TPA: glycosyltransferase family 39 protein [Mycobacterium sp.]|nr:glycosyltransferase family 39 protein [Mycobacterium sp.]
MTSTVEAEETKPVNAEPATRRARLSTKASDRVWLAVLLVGTAVTYLWNITVNGMGNQFYAGAAQAGSQNWEALLFGSLDPRNFITVDKPPVSQWVMGLSGQIFGFSSASMLIPEALMAVATVALLYGAVARVCGLRAGLVAGAALALTPVAALMFRFNNPDAVMVLLMMAAAYCAVRALPKANAKWLVLAGVALGFAFLAKMLEGLMAMPAIGLVYLIAAPTSVRRRLLHILASLAAFVVSAGWFVVLTLAWPASSRPYIAGSTDNNFMNLVLGYNGFARVLGRNHHGGGHPVPQPGPAAHEQGAHGFGGFGNQSQGASRLFSGEFGFEIGWLIPAALLAMVLVVIARGRAPRTDLVRAGAILFGGWLLVDGVVLSYMHGMIHPYYCLSLAPAVAGLFAIGVHEMWQRRTTWFGRLGLSAMVLSTGVWSFWLLHRDADWLPPLRWTILAVTVIAAVALVITARGRYARAVLVAGVLVALAGSAAYAIATIPVAHEGGGPSVGPEQSAHSDGHDGGPGGGHGWGEDADNPQLDAMLSATHTDWSAAITRSSTAASLELKTHTAVMAIGGFSGNDPAPTLDQFRQYVAQHRVTYYIVAENNRDHGQSGPQDSPHADIAGWVAANYRAVKVGSDTVYDLTAPPKR